MKICAMLDCEKPVHGHGLCKVHRQRIVRYGRIDNIRGKRGAGYTNSSGYKLIYVDGILVREHVFLAERALGKKLPPGAIIHHLNENPADNYTALNLVVCPNQAYHKLLHKRGRALGLYSPQKESTRIRAKKNTPATSTHVGVYKHRDKFVAEIWVNYKKHYLGIFNTEEDALRARRATEIKFSSPRSSSNIGL